MKDFSDEIRYGFSLYPFAVIIAVGFLLSSTGPVVLQALMPGLATPGANVALVTSIIALQLLGAVVAAAGFFGALYRIMEDT